MELNSDTIDALNWCVLLEVGMNEDIKKIIGKNIWHNFVFESKEDLLNASKAYRMFYKKTENINNKLKKKTSKKSKKIINNIKKCIQNNIARSAQKFIIEYHIFDIEKIIALSLNPFYPEYHIYQILLNLDVKNDEFVTISYKNIESLKYIIKRNDYQVYQKFWLEVNK